MTLLAHYKLDDTSGTTVTATVGSNGTSLRNASLLHVGAGNGPGGSLQNAGFNLNRLLDSLTYINYPITTAYTLCAWVKTETMITGVDFYPVRQWDTGANSVMLYLTGPAGQTEYNVRAYHVNGVRVNSSPITYSHNVYRHFAMTFGGGSVKLHVNGSQVGATSNGNADVSAVAAAKTVFHGIVADVRIYDSDESGNLDSIIDDARPSLSMTISGTARVGQTLTATPLTNDSTATFEYQWYRADNNSGLNEAPISGATSSTYTTQAADETKVIRCRSAATNTGGALLKSSYVYSDYSAEITTSGGVEATAGVAAAAATAAAPTFATAAPQWAATTATASASCTTPGFAAASPQWQAATASGAATAHAPAAQTAAPQWTVPPATATAGAASPEFATAGGAWSAPAAAATATAATPSYATAAPIVVLGHATSTATAAAPSAASGAVVWQPSDATAIATALAPGAATSGSNWAPDAPLATCTATPPTCGTAPAQWVVGAAIASCTATAPGYLAGLAAAMPFATCAATASSPTYSGAGLVLAPAARLHSVRARSRVYGVCSRSRVHSVRK